MSFTRSIFLFLFICAMGGSSLFAEDISGEDKGFASSSADEPSLESEIANDPELQRIWVDGLRDWLYDKSHGTVENIDQRFVPEGEEPQVVPPSRFRIGVTNEIELKADGKVEWAPILDFKTEVAFPNIERSLKLFVTTQDNTALPGDDAVESDSSLKVGATRSFTEFFDVSAGVKARWTPEVFAHIQWSEKYQVGPWWKAYPRARIFWENDEKFGGILSFVGDRWKNRFVFRNTGSIKWSQKEQEDDERKANDEENVQFGDDGNGVRWQVNTSFAYVTKLLDERDYGRRVNGSDLAAGQGVRVQFRGNAAEYLETKVTLFWKRPLYKDYLYYIVAPEADWADENDFDTEYTLKLGLEMLVWGDKPILSP